MRVVRAMTTGRRKEAERFEGAGEEEGTRGAERKEAGRRNREREDKGPPSDRRQISISPLFSAASQPAPTDRLWRRTDLRPIPTSDTTGFGSCFAACSVAVPLVTNNLARGASKQVGPAG